MSRSKPSRRPGEIRDILPFAIPTAEPGIVESNGRQYELRGWTLREWERLAEKDRPGTALLIKGVAWIDFKPL